MAAPSRRGTRTLAGRIDLQDPSGRWRGRRPLAFLITPGQWGNAPQLIPVMERVRVARPGGGHPRTRPDHLGGDKAYSSAGFGKAIYKRRNEVERTVNRFKNFRAVATRDDKRAYVVHGTVSVAAIRLWFRSTFRAEPARPVVTKCPGSGSPG